MDLLHEAFFLLSHALLEADSPGDPARSRARSWLNRRGFESADFHYLPVGYFADAALIRTELRRSGFSGEEIRASGILGDPRLAGRLVGPIRDTGGRIVGFWARRPDGRRPGTLYLSGRWREATPLMGLEVALGPGAKHGKELVVVADLFDALRLHMRGFLSAAAIGNSPEELTAARWEQLAALGVERVTLLPSGGTAGETITAMGNALHAAAAPAVFVVPPKRSVPGEGPAEAIRALEADDFAAWVRKRQLHGYRYLALAVLAKHRPGSVWTEAARLAALNEAIGIYAAADQRNTAALDAFFVPPILKELEDSPMGAAPRPANAVAANGPTGAPPMPPGGSCPFHGCHKMDCFCWD